jgi:hypothetical protein
MGRLLESLKMFAVILLVAVPSAADHARWEQFHDRIEAAPQPVATFIERRVGCNYWDGEVSGAGDGRDRTIQRERQKLHCDDIERDERQLRKKHRKSPAVLKLLDDTRELGPW